MNLLVILSDYFSSSSQTEKTFKQRMMGEERVEMRQKINKHEIMGAFS